VDECKQLVQVLKAGGRMLGAIVVVESSVLRVMVGATEAKLPILEDYTFPAWRKLVPSVGDAKDTQNIVLNAKFLADIGKIKLPTSTPAEFTFYGDLKPVRVSFADGPVLVQMPVQIR
jgi:hypothetical protein